MRKTYLNAILLAMAMCYLLGSCQDKSSVDITIHMPESSSVSEGPTTTRREPTTGEKNALWSAQNYLDVSAFSKKRVRRPVRIRGLYQVGNCLCNKQLRCRLERTSRFKGTKLSGIYAVFSGRSYRSTRV